METRGSGQSCCGDSVIALYRMEKFNHPPSAGFALLRSRNIIWTPLHPFSGVGVTYTS